jgi:hypothetical protein
MFRRARLRHNLCFSHRVSDPCESLKIALDELRMQMLGAQVLFGFQFHALFQESMQEPTASQRVASAIGFAAILLTIGVLIAATAHHRLRDGGEATARMLALANRYAATALITLALALGCNVYLVTVTHWGHAAALTLLFCTFACCALLWYGLGVVLRSSRGEH